MAARVTQLLFLAVRLSIPVDQSPAQLQAALLIFGFSLPQTAGQRITRLSQWLTFLN
jgi:hypothetical protein